MGGDLTAIVNSFSGWDEIAIEQRFRRSFALMGESSLALRAAHFVSLRRDGMDDKTAHAAAMDITFGELTDIYMQPSGDVSGEASGPDSMPSGPLSSPEE